MRESFRKQLIESGYLHKLLKPDFSKTAENRLMQKRVTDRISLYGSGKNLRWTKEGPGEITQENGTLRITVPARVEPEKPMPHYTGYGDTEAKLQIEEENWTGYNRITCQIRPDWPGYHATYVTLNLRNEGEIKIPDKYDREGHHTLNLNNREWNTCVWEFPDLPRDKVTELSVSIYLAGTEPGGSNEFITEVKDVWLEQAEDPDISLGWQGDPKMVSYSASGYWGKGPKTAVAQIDKGNFRLVSGKSKETILSGILKPIKNEKGTFGLIDFSQVEKPGQYYLVINGTIQSGSFEIHDHVMEEAAWKVLNFIYSERCGFPVGGGHSSCHEDILATHNGLSMVYSGGWHDAGDLSQQTLQTGEVAQALFELAAAVKEDTLLSGRLMEEACWGLDLVLRSRFGDGVRAFSVGISRWTNGLIGDYDGETVRCHNRSFDNFLLSGVEAFAAEQLQTENPELSWVCLNAAKEDYRFARERYDQVGMENCVQMEHTYNASLSQYYAVMAWSSALIYRQTGEMYYEKEAETYSNHMLDCQDIGEAGLPFTGFFYRDETKKHIVHFNHQAREHLFMQALDAVCRSLKGNANLAHWEQAMKRYGDYVKAMYAYSAPYGMLPAGLHRYDETQDRETFALMHLATSYKAEKENYRKQLKSGIPVDKLHCIRQFPVWFSFRGNEAVLLSSGKGAAICGRYFDDRKLLNIARDQMYFTAGKNPFAQSLIFGEGENYAQQYAAHNGTQTGQIPVGIQTRGNEDVPYWPMANNATYKEVWMTSAGHWIRLLADLY